MLERRTVCPRTEGADLTANSSCSPAGLLDGRHVRLRRPLVRAARICHNLDALATALKPFGALGRRPMDPHDDNHSGEGGGQRRSP